MNIITIANQKGGVGKTTTTFTLGKALADKKNKVCLIDLDPQGGLTLSMGINPDKLENTVYDGLIGEKKGNEIIIHMDNLDLIPANIDLSAAEVELLNELGREQILHELLSHLDYDFVLIDTPPSLGLLSINALVASNGIIIPVESKYLGLRGLSLLIKTIEKVKNKLRPDIQIIGIIPTMFDRTIHSREVVEELKNSLGQNIKILPEIKRTVKVAESAVASESIIDYAPNSDTAKNYNLIAKEILKWAKSLH